MTHAALILAANAEDQARLDAYLHELRSNATEEELQRLLMMCAPLPTTSAPAQAASDGGPRGDHPRDVILGPSAGDSLAAMNIDLPEEVANDELDDLLEDVTTATPKKEDVATDELDDLFVDVKTASPKKEDRSLAKTLRNKKKRNTLVCSLGPPLQNPGHSGARACP